VLLATLTVIVVALGVYPAPLWRLIEAAARAL
jgi:NADH:ubiquinone oxidoreductase subunit 4 (subunit M)